MNILVDENIPRMTVTALREMGHDVKIHVRILAALKRYSEKQWRRLLVVMQDAVQSTYKSRKSKP